MTLRSVVRISSSVQLAFGLVAAYLLLMCERPDAVALLITGTIIITGMAGFMDLQDEPRHRRRTTIRLNAVLTVLLLTGSAVMILIERQQGLDFLRQCTLAGLAVAVAAPFITNAAALARLEHRHRHASLPVPVSRSDVRTRS